MSEPDEPVGRDDSAELPEDARDAADEPNGRRDDPADEPSGRRDDSVGVPEVGRDEESPVADNDAAEGAATPSSGGRSRCWCAVQPGTGRRRGDAGMQIASAWAWRFLVIVAAVVVIGYGMRYLSEVVVPVTVGVLLTALLVPVTNGLQRLRMPRGPAAGITVVGTIALVAGLLTLVGTQIATQFDDLSTQVGEGVQKLRDLARINLNVTDKDITDALEQAAGHRHQRRRPRPAGGRGRHHRDARRRRAVHLAVLPVLLPVPGDADLGLAGPAVPAAGPRQGGLVRPQGAGSR